MSWYEVQPDLPRTTARAMGSLHKEANLRTSISRQGEDATAGTLDGFLELEDPVDSKWKMFGLTWYHSVVPEICKGNGSQGVDGISASERQGKYFLRSLEI